MARNGNSGAPELMVLMRSTASSDEVDHIVGLIQESGAGAHVDQSGEATVIGVIGQRAQIAALPFEGLPGVDRVVPLRKGFKWVSREYLDRDTVHRHLRTQGRRPPLRDDGRPVRRRELRADAAGRQGRQGGRRHAAARRRLQAALVALRLPGPRRARAGDPRPRSAGRPGLPVATELMDARDLEPVLEHIDLIWIGARNMANFNLLSELGRVRKPVMLKRGMSATVEELLMAAEYVAKEGNEDIILCERGIRTFERSTRFTLDIGAIPVLKAETHLPVIVDPSHAAGKRQLVAPLARAAVAAGADGLIVETHPNPEHALSDAAQQLPVRQLRRRSSARWSSSSRSTARRSPGRPAVRVAIVGLGLMGGSLGLALRERARADVVGLRPGPGRARAGARARLRRRRCTTPSAAACADADLVVVCAPVAQLPAAVAGAAGGRAGVGHRHRHRLHQGEPRARRRRRRTAAASSAGIPVCGSEARGPGSARAEIFDGATWFLTPVAETDPARYAGLVARAGAPSARARSRSRPAPTTGSWR